MSEFVTARKGNLVVFGRDHSYNTADFKRHSYRQWYVGVVASATRDGHIKTVSAGNSAPHEIDKRIPSSVASFEKVSAEKAEQLSKQFADSTFETHEQAAAAVKAAVAA